MDMGGLFPQWPEYRADYSFPGYIVCTVFVILFSLGSLRRLSVQSLKSGFTTARLIKQHTVISTDHMTPEIKLHLITPLCELWTANADNIPFHDPFWAFYWPGGQAIARYILDNPQLMLGRHVLDVGSGSGACAIAAVKSGALSVTANDIDPVAATAIKMNAALNAVNIDVCTENLVGKCCVKWNCILLGDMVYDAEFTGQLLKWLNAIRCKGKLVLLGDPGRQALKDITENCLTEVARYRLLKNACLENRGFTDASVWRLYSMQYSAGLLCTDSLLLMSLDAAGTNDKHALLAVPRWLLLSSHTAEWAELVCWQIAMPLANRQDIVATVGKNDYGCRSVIALCAGLR